MKVDQASLAYMQKVVQTADLFKISSVIIEPNRVRAIDDTRAVFILEEQNIPDLPFGSIGMNRLDLFASRYEIVKTIDNFVMEAVVEGDDNMFARALTMKAKGIKVDYRCANPATIQAPKAMNDVVKYKVEFTPAALSYIQKGQSAMAADEITFVGTKDGVSFEIADINTDKLAYQFADTVTNVVEGDVSDAIFTHKYPIKLIATLFKANTSGHFFLTNRGMLKAVINGLSVVILPRT